MKMTPTNKRGIATTNKNHRSLHINRKCHDHRTDYDKRTSQKKTKSHVDAVLDLVDIIGHPCDQGVRTDRIKFGK